MRVLVCGGRSYTDRSRLFSCLDWWHAWAPVGVLVHGAAPGADSLADEWAQQRGILRDPHPADWQRYGKARAGPIRNARMLALGRPAVVLAFPGGTGTADMVARALAAGVPVVWPELWVTCAWPGPSGAPRG